MDRYFAPRWDAVLNTFFLLQFFVPRKSNSHSQRSCFLDYAALAEAWRGK